MSDSGGDKKHSASEKKRRESREQGQVAKSQDLTSAGLLLAALSALWFLGEPAARQMATAMADALSRPNIVAPGTNDAVNWLLVGAARLAMASVPMLIAMFVAGIMVNVIQTGLIFSTSKIEPKLSNIDPLSGAKRILSLQGVMRLGFGIFKLLIIAAVAYVALKNYRDPIMGMASLSVPQICVVMFDALIGTCIWIGVALFILAILEWAFQKWKQEQDMMMTDQELRDEAKESEGDPQVAQRRRQVQRQMMAAASRKRSPKGRRRGQQSDRASDRDQVRPDVDAGSDRVSEGRRSAGAEDPPDRTGKRHPGRRTQAACTSPVQDRRRRPSRADGTVSSRRRSAAVRVPTARQRDPEGNRSVDLDNAKGKKGRVGPGASATQDPPNTSCRRGGSCVADAPGPTLPAAVGQEGSIGTMDLLCISRPFRGRACGCVAA